MESLLPIVVRIYGALFLLSLMVSLVSCRPEPALGGLIAGLYVCGLVWWIERMEQR